MDAADIERADWMAAVDLKILAYYYNRNPDIYGPSTVAKNIRRTDGDSYNGDYINQRMLTLADVDLLEKLERGEYRISETGIEYVDGEIGPDELPD
ncbi:hypothetical protein [Natronorubrum sp. DTA7]|uniref:hypothetical protein n=1 Tax=Natronorubrum sp. DTA7 TaxID=3447016 RepID=UPI003F83B3B7